MYTHIYIYMFYVISAADKRGTHMDSRAKRNTIMVKGQNKTKTCIK